MNKKIKQEDKKKNTKKSLLKVSEKQKKETKSKLKKEASRLRIKVRAYENKILDASVKQIIETLLRLGANISGPVPLPTEIRRYTVNSSPFVYKSAQEQFEIRVHKRLIDILEPSQKIIEALTNLNLPAGIDIEVSNV